jgi:hypothetical protein
MSSSIVLDLQDKTGLKSSKGTAWVAGWINGESDTFQVLQQDGSFCAPPANTGLRFFKVSDVPAVTLDTATNGNDRLLFVVSKDKPSDLTITGTTPVAYTQYPYLSPPGVAAPGPFDVFEFGMNAQFDLSAVSGFGLNLRFEIAHDCDDEAPTRFGVREGISRADIKTAYGKFIANEAVSFPAAAYFA